MVRLAEANARARLSKKVEEVDAQRAIDLIKYYMMQVGYDEETQSFDVDKIAGNPASKRSKIHLIKEKITALEERLGKLIPMEELEKEIEEKMTKEEFEEALDKLIRSGDLFRPRRGYIQKV